jgi:hypothetical protein
VKNKRKLPSVLYVVGFALIFIPPLVVVAILKWAGPKIPVGFTFGVLLALAIIGAILILADFIKVSVQGIRSVKSKLKSKLIYAASEILFIAIVPFLIYFGINPSINNSQICKTELVNDLLIVSTVLLGFTMVVGGIRQRIPPKKLRNELDNKALTFAKSCLILSLVIGFNTVVWILRWLVVSSDQLLNWVIALFSFQVPLTFISSYAHLYFRIFYPEKDES